MKKRIEILGIPLDAVTRKEAAKCFVDFCNGTKQVFTATPNAEILLEAQNNEELKEYLRACKLNVADSVSLLWASMFQEKKWSKFRAVFELFFLPIRKSFWTEVLPERVCGSDIIFDICEQAEIQEKSIFLMGSMGDTAIKTKEILENKYPKLSIVGALSGSPRKEDEEEIIQKINNANPDMLFLAYGCPAQELWIQRNLKKCPSVKVAMGIGGTFDFITGNIKRAPKIFQSLGLEWLWRLMLQPSRWKRIFRAVFLFPWKFIVTSK